MLQIHNQMMTERFYSIDHLTTEQLRELYTYYRDYGSTDARFYKRMPEGINAPELSSEEIIVNIDADHEHNYLVVMANSQNEEESIMIGLGMSYHPSFAVYLHLHLSFLNELILKYNLIAIQKAQSYIITEYLMEQARNNSQN